MSDVATTTKKGSGKIGNAVKVVKAAFKDAVPATKGGKIVAASVGTAGMIGSFFLGRLSKGGKKKAEK